MEERVKASMINLAISRLSETEADELLNLADAAIGQVGKTGTLAQYSIFAKEETSSIAVKTVTLVISQYARQSSRSANPVQRVDAIKGLTRLREQILGHILRISDRIALAEQEITDAPTPPDVDMSLEGGIKRVYEMTARRSPVDEEITIWKNNFQQGLQFHEFLTLMGNSPEAVARRKEQDDILSDLSDGEFVQWAFELIHGRGATAFEISHWRSRISTGAITRSGMLNNLFSDAVEYQRSGQAKVLHDGLSCHIMGTPRHLTLREWQLKAEEIKTSPPERPASRFANRFAIRTKPSYLVTAVASMYRGADFIEQFMDNITSQSCFSSHCELVIVDADSPENEYETIKRYIADFPNINYLRMNYLVGIYDAWNIGIKAARGQYITNSNLDDLRRSDSFELQAGTLDNLEFVDIVYQDFYYSFDPRLSVEEIADFGYRSSVPVITPFNMMKSNSPHNAPMWRKRLHDELGYFDTNFKSAGDYEFWMRCLAAGKSFYKINDPHAVYYQNPKGLSTRADTRGIVEGKEILTMYGRKLIPEALLVPIEQFKTDVLGDPVVARLSTSEDRYRLTQAALRNAARRFKSAGAAKG